MTILSRLIYQPHFLPNMFDVIARFGVHLFHPRPQAFQELERLIRKSFDIVEVFSTSEHPHWYCLFLSKLFTCSYISLNFGCSSIAVLNFSP